MTNEEPDELVKQADIALYKAKEEGRNRLAFFDPQLQAEVNARAELLKALRGAIPRDELRLYYQPVVDASMKIIGVEALIRWEREHVGLVSPANFIPLAEQSNLIIPIGEWVLRTACNQLKAWERDEVRKHWTVAVNVSAKQFHDDHFASCVMRTLEETQASAAKLRVEITESMMQVNLEQTIVTMHELRSLGVLFSLDDFGTGYSSLSYLKKLPLDQLKIDRSFVADVNRDPNDAAIVRTVLSLAEHLSLQVVAEGVETVEQKQVLLSYGCHAFQGFLFGRPVPAEQIRAQLESVEVARAVLDRVMERSYMAKVTARRHDPTRRVANREDRQIEVIRRGRRCCVPPPHAAHGWRRHVRGSRRVAPRWRARCDPARGSSSTWALAPRWRRGRATRSVWATCSACVP